MRASDAAPGDGRGRRTPIEPFFGHAVVDARIHECFGHIHTDDVGKFRKKLRSPDRQLKAHTYRELVAGSYLAQAGLGPRYEWLLDGKTPDWVLVRPPAEVTGIIELVNFHKDRPTEQAVNFDIQLSGSTCHWMPPNGPRLYLALQEKADRYDAIVAARRIGCVVAVFSTFVAAIDEHEIQSVLFEDHNGGIFAYTRRLSGVLFFKESWGQYHFAYFANPNAEVSITIPSGVLNALFNT